MSSIVSATLELTLSNLTSGSLERVQGDIIYLCPKHLRRNPLREFGAVRDPSGPAGCDSATLRDGPSSVGRGISAVANVRRAHSLRWKRSRPAGHPHRHGIGRVRRFPRLLFSVPPRCVREARRKPAARYQAIHSHTVANACFRVMALDEIGRHLVPLLDGSRTHRQIAE